MVNILMTPTPITFDYITLATIILLIIGGIIYYVKFPSESRASFKLYCLLLGNCVKDCNDPRTGKWKNVVFYGIYYVRVEGHCVDVYDIDTDVRIARIVRKIHNNECVVETEAYTTGRYLYDYIKRQKPRLWVKDSPITLRMQNRGLPLQYTTYKTYLTQTSVNPIFLVTTTGVEIALSVLIVNDDILDNAASNTLTTAKR